MKYTKYKDLNIIQKVLIDRATEARENAYAPYSKFKVGAAVLTSEDYYLGCNVESADYTLTTHAEMNAIDTMVAEGKRKIRAIAIVIDGKEPVMPCGLCRQKINEFAEGNTEIIAANLEGLVNISTIKELLPEAFGPKDLGINTGGK